MENNWSSVQIEEQDQPIQELVFRPVPDFIQPSTNANGGVLNGSISETVQLANILRNNRLRAMLFRFCSIMNLQCGTDAQRDALRRILAAPNENTGIQIDEDGNTSSVDSILQHCIYRSSNITADQSPVLNNTGAPGIEGLIF